MVFPSSTQICLKEAKISVRFSPLTLSTYRHSLKKGVAQGQGAKCHGVLSPAQIMDTACLLLRCGCGKKPSIQTSVCYNHTWSTAMIYTPTASSTTEADTLSAMIVFFLSIVWTVPTNDNSWNQLCAQSNSPADCNCAILIEMFRNKSCYIVPLFQLLAEFEV